MSKNLDGKTKQQSLTNFFAKKSETKQQDQIPPKPAAQTSPCIFNKFEKIVS